MKSILIITFLFGLTATTFCQSNDYDSIYSNPDSFPEFPGGMDSLQYYLAHNLTYPEEAILYGLEGKCYVQFVIDTLGKVTNISIYRGVPDCLECDKEAVRVVRNMPDWKPGTSDGKVVNCTMQLPIQFDLVSRRELKKRKKSKQNE